MALGSIDASIECAKGFKLLDSIPGLWLADGVGATVLHLDKDNKGEPFWFGTDRRLEAIFAADSRTWAKALEEYRVRFVVAATRELAGEITSALSSGRTERKGDAPVGSTRRLTRPGPGSSAASAPSARRPQPPKSEG